MQEQKSMSNLVGSLNNITVASMRALKLRMFFALLIKGRPPLEQSATSGQLRFLAETAREIGASQIGEIGFNAGYSAQAFLSASSNSHVTSFDLVTHGYTPLAKKRVDAIHPGRHTLVEGDSTATVPEFSQQNPGRRFDLIFIDGGHSYDVAKADIRNMESLAHGNTLVIMDDLTPWLPWGKGPSRAWTEAQTNGIIEEIEIYKDGNSVEHAIPPGKRAWALGRYLSPMSS